MEKKELKSIYIILTHGGQAGPYTFLEVKKLLDQKKIKRGDYAFKKGELDWEYLGEYPEFNQRDVLTTPPLPTFTHGGIADLDHWFVQSADGVVQGPYSTLQLKEFLLVRKVRRSALTWTRGMREWQKLLNIPEFYNECYPNMPKGAPLFQEVSEIPQTDVRGFLYEHKVTLILSAIVVVQAIIIIFLLL